MAPVLFSCPLFTIYTYGVFVALAFLVSVPLWTPEAGRRGFDAERITTLGLLILASGVAGARLLYVLLNWQDFNADVLEVFRLQHGGLAWFGGLVGALACLVLYVRRQRWSVTAVLDSIVPFAALGQGIGRIGCFFNGCCYGFPVAWGVYFGAHGTRLFPTQLVDAATLFIVFACLKRMQRLDTTGQGRIAAWYLVAAGLQRFLMEFLRADVRPFYFSLSIFQWMALAVLGAGAAGLGILRCRRGAA